MLGSHLYSAVCILPYQLSLRVIPSNLNSTSDLIESTFSSPLSISILRPFPPSPLQHLWLEGSMQLNTIFWTKFILCDICWFIPWVWFPLLQVVWVRPFSFPLYLQYEPLFGPVLCRLPSVFISYIECSVLLLWLTLLQLFSSFPFEQTGINDPFISISFYAS